MKCLDLSLDGHLFVSSFTKRIDGLTVKQFTVASAECIPRVSLEDLLLSITTSTMKGYNTCVCHYRRDLIGRCKTASDSQACSAGGNAMRRTAPRIAPRRAECRRYPHQETMGTPALHNSDHFICSVRHTRGILPGIFDSTFIFFRLKPSKPAQLFSHLDFFHPTDQQSSRGGNRLQNFLQMWVFFSLLEAVSFISPSLRRGHVTLLP